MVIRPEQPDHAAAIYTVHAASFPSAAEARLVDLLRAAGRLRVRKKVRKKRKKEEEKGVRNRFRRKRRRKRFLTPFSPFFFPLFRPGGPLVVRAEVEQEFIGRVAIGQAAAVEDEFHAGGPWRGRVLRIADWHSPHRALLQQPPRFTDVPTVECLIALDPECPRLRLGQRVRVSILPMTSD